MWSSQSRSTAIRIGDPGYDISSKKHVSFDSGDTNRVRRSVTCAAIPRQSGRNASPPSISRTSSMSSSRRDMSPPVASQERLLGSKSSQHNIATTSSSATTLTATGDHNVKPVHQSVSPSLSYTPSLSTPCRILRRVIMKTQATQTEAQTLVKSRSARSIPAYLTLSPRAANQTIVQRRSFDLRVPTTSPISLCEYHQRLILRQTSSWCDSEGQSMSALPPRKSRSVHDCITIDTTNSLEFNDEIMAVCVDRDVLAGLIPIASPPPGFGDNNNDVFADDFGTNRSDDNNKELSEISPKKSTSESSHVAVANDGSDIISSTTTDMDDLLSSADNSKVTMSSPTVVSELNQSLTSTPPLIQTSGADSSVDLLPLDSPISRLKKQLMETLISPDSESS
ncbi:unnamed protein product, partial [Oppiella nova]